MTHFVLRSNILGRTLIFLALSRARHCGFKLECKCLQLLLSFCLCCNCFF